MKQSILVLRVLALAILASASRATDAASEAIPASQRSLYHVDLARHFFESPEKEESERAQFRAKLAELERFKGKVSTISSSFSKGRARLPSWRLRKRSSSRRSTERRGEHLTADRYDALTLDVYSRYSIWPRINNELKSRWMTTVLMYQDPFYNINYVWGGILALVYYDLYKADPGAFAQRFQKLMRNGFDAPPDDLLREFMGIELRDADALVARAMRVLTEKVEEYSALQGSTGSEH